MAVVIIMEAKEEVRHSGIGRKSRVDGRVKTNAGLSPRRLQLVSSVVQLYHLHYVSYVTTIGWVHL